MHLISLLNRWIEFFSKSLTSNNFVSLPSRFLGRIFEDAKYLPGSPYTHTQRDCQFFSCRYFVKPYNLIKSIYSVLKN